MTPDQCKIVALKRQIASLKRKLAGQTLKKVNKKGKLPVSALELAEIVDFSERHNYINGWNFNYTCRDHVTRMFQVQARHGIRTVVLAN